MSAFLLPLHFACPQAKKGFKGFDFLAACADQSMHRLATSAPASISQKLSSLRNSEYSSGKSHPQPSWPILENEISAGRRLSKLTKTPAFMRVHNISCTHELRGLMTTISTLPQRYRSCKSVPFRSELQFILRCFPHRCIGPRSIARNYYRIEKTDRSMSSSSSRSPTRLSALGSRLSALIRSVIPSEVRSTEPRNPRISSAQPRMPPPDRHHRTRHRKMRGFLHSAGR